MALITEAQFRTEYPQLIGTAENTRLADAIGKASAVMAMYCDWGLNDSAVYSFETSAYTRFPAPRHDNPSVIDLPHGYVTSITSAHIDPDWLSDIAGAYASGDEVASGDRLLDTKTRELWIGSSASPNSQWSYTERANKIILVGGFAASTTQAEVVWACCVIVRHILGLARMDQVTTLTQGGQSMTRSDIDALVPSSARHILDCYRVWRSSVG